MMTNREAIDILLGFQEPEAWEKPITEEAFDALAMAIDILDKTDNDSRIVLKMKMPKSCLDCGFRLNRSRESWRCGLHKAYRGGAAYIPKGIYPRADKERPACCPLDKRRPIDDE